MTNTITTADDTTMKILGHTFRRMDSHDYLGFAGAEPDSWICDEPHDLPDTVLIWEPKSGDLVCVETDGTEVVWGVRRC